MVNAACILLWFLGGFQMYLSLLGLPKKLNPPENHPEWATVGNIFWAIMWPIPMILLIVKVLFVKVEKEAQ
jgi:hypothetical protein